MKMRSIILCFLFAAGSLVPARSAETDKEVQARQVALDLAGAFSNDAFKLRDGHWSGEIKKGETAVIAVNLYAGNEYWFSVGATDAGKFAVHIFDEKGKPVAADDYDEDDKAAAGFAPSVSGQYFVSIAPEGDAAGAYCLVYSYK